MNAPSRLPVNVLSGDRDLGAAAPTSTAAAIAVNGGATMMSQCLDAATSGLNASKKARVSACVLYIFQLPAMTGRRNQTPSYRVGR